MTDAEKPAAKLEKLLYFFKIFRRDVGEVPTGEDIRNALNRITLDDRFIRLDTGNNLSFVDFGNKDGHVRIVITTLRRFWSKVQDGSSLTDLKLSGKQELAETAHLVIFDDGIIGIEFNHHGPKMSQFADLLDEKCPELGKLAFLTCMQKQTKERVQKARVIKKVKLRVWQADSDCITDDSLKNALRKTMKIFDADNIEIIIRNPKNDVSKFEKITKGLISGLLGYKSEVPAYQPTLRAEAVDKDGVEHAFNLFQSQISLRKTVSFDDDGQSRYIDSETWFKHIIHEKERLQPVLKHATFAEVRPVKNVQRETE